MSQSLLKAGGDSIQQDLIQNYPKGLGDGEIAVSVGGNLKCKHMLHGALMNWDQGDKAIPVRNVGFCSVSQNRVVTRLCVYITFHFRYLYVEVHNKQPISKCYFF